MEDVNYSSRNVVALILGILSIVFCCCGIVSVPLAIVAIVLGNKAKTEGIQDGKGKAGVVLGIIGIIFTVVAFVIICISIISSAVSDKMDEIRESTATEEYTIDMGDATESTTEGDVGSDTGNESSETESYLPAYDVEIMGEEGAGYTYYPKDWVTFQEIGGTGYDYTEQYTNGVDIINLSYTEKPDNDASETAAAWVYSLENDPECETDSITVSEESINGYDGYSIMSYWPSDKMFLYQWMFDDEEGGLHYLSAEFVAGDEYEDVWETLFYNYSIDGSTVGK